MAFLHRVRAALRTPALLVVLTAVAFCVGMVAMYQLPRIGVVQLTFGLGALGAIVVLAIGLLRDGDRSRQLLLFVLLLLADWSVGVQAEFEGKAFVVIGVAALLLLSPFPFKTLDAPAQLLLGLGAIAVASSAWSEDRLTSFALALGLLAAIISIPRLFAAFPSEVALLRAIFFACATLLALSIVAYVLVPKIGASGRESFGPLPRMKGIIGHPNRVARLAGLSVIVLLALRRRSGLPHWMYVPAAGLVGLSVVLSQSRTVVIALTFALLFMSWARRGVANTPVLLASVIVAGVVLTAMPTVVDDVLESSTRSENASSVLDEGRGPLWATVIERGNERPLLGHGYAQPSVGDEFVSYGLASQPWVTRKAHNLFLYVYFTMGFAGVAAFGAMIVTYIARARRRPVDYADGFFAFVLASGMTSSLVGTGGPALMTFSLIMAISARSAPWHARQAMQGRSALLGVGS